MTLRRFVETVEAILIVFMVWFAILVAHYNPATGSKSGTIVPNLLHATRTTDVTIILAVLGVDIAVATVGLLAGQHHVNQVGMLICGAWWLFVAKVALDSAPWGTAVPAYTMAAALCFAVWQARRRWGGLL